MATVTNSAVTATMRGIREDLTDQIHRVDVEDTPFMSTVPTTTAKQTLHEWQTEALENVNLNNAVPEGDAVARTAAINTVRLSNICQISRKDATVSGTLEAVDKAGRDKEMARQLALKTIGMRKDMEAILLTNQAFNTNATVNSETGVRQCRSMEAWLRTNTSRGVSGANPADPTVTPGTTATDGTQRAFTELLLLNTLQSVFDSGGNVKLAMMGSWVKRVASGFAGRTGTNIDVGKKEIQQAANVYRSDFGDINLIAHRYQRARTCFLLDPSKVKVAYLQGRRFKRFPLGTIGDAETNVLVSEYTLEMCNERAHGVIADLLTS
jgi:hypothetical protein